MLILALIILSVTQSEQLSMNIHLETNNVSVNSKELDKAIQYTVKEFDKYHNHDNSPELIKKYGLKIYFSPVYYGSYPETCPIEDSEEAKRLCRGFYCEIGSTGWCLGYFNNWMKTIVISNTSTCIADTAIVHELLHFLYEINYGSTIPDHVDREIFAAGCTPYGPEQRKCYRNSMERRIERQLRSNFCKDNSK